MDKKEKRLRRLLKGMGIIFAGLSGIVSKYMIFDGKILMLIPTLWFGTMSWIFMEMGIGEWDKDESRNRP